MPSTNCVDPMKPLGGGQANSQASLMTSSDLRGQLVELKRPDCGNLKKDTVNGILQISSGEYAGQLAFFPRHSLHLFGHNMHKANLMDVVQYKEEYQVELIGGTNNKSIPFTCRAAWIGPRPSSTSSKVEMTNNATFKTWLAKHKLTELEFLDCVKGQRPPRPFFPIQTSNIFPAKVVALEQSTQGVQAGILAILKGPLEKQLVVFEANCTFLHTVHFSQGSDLSYIFKENDKVTVETTEFSGGKERKRIYAKVKTSLEKLSSLPPPAHYAQLVYVGSRPKAANCCLTEPLTELQVQHTPNLKLWLGKRNLSCGFFSSLIRGLVPPKTIPTNVADDKKANDNEFVMAAATTALEGPASVPQQVVNETMAKTNAMVARLMKCTSPEDPAIQNVITSKDDLELAIFMSKALSKAIGQHVSQNSGSGANENWNSVELTAQHRPPRPIAPPSRSIRETVSPPQLPTQFQPQPDHSINTTLTMSNFQQRGLTGLREPLLNYEPRQRRRSGEHFNNSWVEPPFKLCKAASSNHFR